MRDGRVKEDLGNYYKQLIYLGVCTVSLNEKLACEMVACGGWGPWTWAGACTPACAAQGARLRHRICPPPSICIGTASELVRCHEEPC